MVILIMILLKYIIEGFPLNNKYGIINYDTLNQVKVSYLGHLKYGNCNKLIRNSLNKLDSKYSDLGRYVRIEDYL